jgi:hypothetical protein
MSAKRNINDSTVEFLKTHGIPVTRENYLHVAFLGSPPDEPLDGEIEAELPRFLQLDICRRRWREELRTAMKNKFGRR